MMGRKWKGRAWLLLGFLLAWSAEGGARELYRQPPGQAERQATRSQKAGRDTAPLSFEGVSRGMISFHLRRDPASTSDRSGAVPVKFLDAQGKTVFVLRVACVFDGDPNRAALNLLGPEFSRKGLGLWDPLILLSRRIEPGQESHFDLTWDDEKVEYGLFVDGRAVDPRPGTYDTARQAFGRSVRELANEQMSRFGEPLPFLSLPFGYFLSQVKTIVVGDTPDSRLGRNPKKNSLVGDTRIDHLVVAAGEPVVPVTKVHRRGYDVRDLVGAHTAGGVRLTWQAPEVHGINQGYYVHRRTGEGSARFERLTSERVYDLSYLDATAQAGLSYRYSVTAVYGDGKGGDVESKYPPEVTATAGDVAVASVAADKRLYGAGQEIVVTLRGTPDGQASFTLAGVTQAPAAMEEVDDGVYVGRVAIPAGASLPAAALTGTLALGGETATAAGPAVTLDTAAPGAVAPGRIVVSVPWAGEVEVSWEKSASPDVEAYRVYRSTSESVATAGAPHAQVRETRFVDTAVVPGLTYRYAVVVVDKAGNPSAPSDVVAATAVAGEGPALTGITVEPFGKPLRPGQSTTLTVTGQSGGALRVDLGTLATGVALVEQGRTGRYVGTYTVKDADLVPNKSLHRVVAHLADAYGKSDLAGPEVAVVGRNALNDQTQPVIQSAVHDGFQVAGFSGKLVAGDVLTVTLEGEPAGYASFAIAGVTQGVVMAESATKPGTYTGTYTVGWDTEGLDVPVTVTLADDAGNETTRTTGPVSFDTRVRLFVTAKDALLPADQKSTTRLVARATDANGDEVSGHELALTLSTTEEYTGVVGGGRIEGKEARMEDVDDVEVKWGGVTDNFGEVAATYTAGFAAKTALVLAKDLTTGDVGAGWLHTYVAAAVALEVLPRAARGAADQAILRLTADPTKLTADGRSTSRLTAVLTDLGGNPLPDRRVAFALGNDNGRVRVLDATTDAKGVAEAEYRAGTLLGTVTVTASVQELGVTASVQIVLMADAPAKIELVASAAKVVSGEQATLSVTVTDIHDNPNAQVPVTFRVLQGAGSVAASELLTDRNGEGAATFTAGSRPGIAVVEARHTSRAPTDEELRRVYGTVFVPRLAERQERDRVKVAEWLVEPGDEVDKGQALITLEGGKGAWRLPAPEKGIFVREVKHRRDRVELGETLGYVEIDPEIWEGYGEDD